MPRWQRAAELGAEHADFRAERIRSQEIGLSDGNLETSYDADDAGARRSRGGRGDLGLRLGRRPHPRRGGARGRRRPSTSPGWPPLSTPSGSSWPRSPSTASDLGIGLPGGPVRASRSPTRSTLLAGWSRRAAGPRRGGSRGRVAAAGQGEQVLRRPGGTRATQQRVRLHPGAHRGRGGRARRPLRDHAHARAAGRARLGVPDRRRPRAGTWRPSWPSCPACWPRSWPRRRSRRAATTWSIDPSNLWLTIHESIGHATELDRALGYEAAYAGTSFATLDQLGTPAVRLAAHARDRGPHRRARPGDDRLRRRGRRRASLGPDHAAGSWSDTSSTGGWRRLKRRWGRSNGCAFADSPGHMPIQRMANVSLQPAPDGPSTAELIARRRGRDLRRRRQELVDRHAAVQLPVHRPAVLRDHAAGAWPVSSATSRTRPRPPISGASMEAVGGPQTYVLGGAFNCGKGQPGQVAPVSHGCPAALFRGVRILNTGAGGHGERDHGGDERRRAQCERALGRAGVATRRLRGHRRGDVAAPTCAGPTTR